MAHPSRTEALALREDGFAAAPTSAVPGRLDTLVEHREVALPALKPGQVLIEVIMAPVNPSDLFFIQGSYGQPRVQGQAPGFEGVGRVLASGGGDGADALIGARVAFLGTVSGSWAAHAVGDAALCIPLRDDLRDEDGAALIVNPLTALALLEGVRAAGTDAFILNAAGSQLGRLMLALARDQGLKALTVIRRPDDAEALRGLGAAEVLVSSDPGFATQAGAAIRAHKPRVLLDAVGDQGAADLFFAMPAGTRWVSYGKMSDDAPRLSQIGQLIFMDKRIEGFWLSRWLPAAPPERRAALVAEVQERFATGAWETRIGARLKLTEAVEGILPALARGNGKVMLTP
ncbi:MAG: zinc-binding dehydrogenase [Pararhodobacter sp.]|nr:zinc-binding dehydrogenase [Pararhodobacter sp.]